jgi:ATP-dependent DNA helicase DinG
VATANISLQEQLVNKDLPALQDVLPWDFTYALLKGRSNYLCMSKVIGGELQDAPGSREDRVRLLNWSDTTDTGDKSELDFDTGPMWGYCSSTSNECPGSKCGYSGVCFANRARRHAMGQDVVVTNYHVLLLAKALMTSHRVLICDEAHNLAQIARSALGWNISKGSFRKVVSWIARHNENAANALQQRSTELVEKLQDCLGKRKTVRLHEWDQVGYKTEGLLKALSLCHATALSAEGAAGSAGNIKAAAAAALMCKRLDNLYQRIENVSDGRFSSWVYWVQDHQTRGAMLSAAPIELDKLLPELIFDTPDSVLLTSATMTSNRSFDFIRDELGVPDALEVIAASPFDLKKQGVIVVPKDIPSPPTGRDREGEQEWLNAVLMKATEMIEMCRGRTLLLFTSWKTLNYVHSNLHVQYPVLKQGEMPTSKLVEQFRREVDSVLLGVASMWEGVDVPGEALTGLLIDKIPFPVPVDPVVEAAAELVEKRGGNSFFDYSLPKATISLCQGIGRLIRSTTDRGVVVITDRRLIDKRYGEKMIKSLPPFWKTQNMKDAWEMLGRAEDG